MTIFTLVDFLRDNDIAVRITLASVFLITLVILIFVSSKIEKSHTSNSGKIKKLAAISVLTAISVLLYYFVKFPIPIFVSFLELNISNLPIYIGGFLFGPVTGSIIVVVRFLAKLPGSTSLGVGELMDLLIGLATVLASSIMYHRHKSKKTAKKALIWIVVIWVVVGVFSNWLFIAPFYEQLYYPAVIYDTLNALNSTIHIYPGLTADNYMVYYLLFNILPFNIIVSSITVSITYVVYKRVSVIYEDIHFHHDHDEKEQIEQKDETKE